MDAGDCNVVVDIGDDNVAAGTDGDDAVDTGSVAALAAVDTRSDDVEVNDVDVIVDTGNGNVVVDTGDGTVVAGTDGDAAVLVDINDDITFADVAVAVAADITTNRVVAVVVGAGDGGVIGETDKGEVSITDTGSGIVAVVDTSRGDVAGKG